MTRFAPRAAIALASLFGAAACVPVGAPAPSPVARAAPSSYGVVVSSRPIIAASAAAAPGADIRGSILAAVGSGAAAAPAEAATEIIVRADDGRTLSVVQVGDALPPGTRVMLSSGGRTRLARATN